MTPSKIYLSPPELAGDEPARICAAIASGWIAPLGPEVDAFETECAAVVGMPHGVALSSGTAALHLALEVLGVTTGDEVWCSTLTFAATANAIRYTGAVPVFIDSERATWNMDAALLATALDDAASRNALPKAVIAVDLYGQCAAWNEISAACQRHGVPLIEDAAEALGATYNDRPAGSFAELSILSFNGNKIITTSGGGMLLTRQREHAERARYLATQAREPARHYEHVVVGYNYRLSNLLASFGRVQLADLPRRVNARRAIRTRYQAVLGALPGWEFMPEAAGHRSTAWLTCATIDAEAFGATRDQVIDALTEANIEARPVWKPMHAQPVFASYRSIGGAVADDLFARGICLPSGSSLSLADQQRIIDIVRSTGRS